MKQRTVIAILIALVSGSAATADNEAELNARKQAAAAVTKEFVTELSNALPGLGKLPSAARPDRPPAARQVPGSKPAASWHDACSIGERKDEADRIFALRATHPHPCRSKPVRGAGGGGRL